MDHFREESVHKKKVGLNSVLYILAWIGLVVFGIVAVFYLNMLFFSFQFTVPNIVGALIFGGATVGLFYVKNNLKIEYDYTFTNGTLDVAKVINNSKRKKLLTLDVRSAEKISPTDDGEFDRVLEMQYAKKYNYFLNPGRLYYIIYSDQGGKKLLVFEPSEEFVKNIKVYNPGNTTV